MPITAAAGDAFAHKFAKQFAAGFAGNNHAVTMEGLLAPKLSWDWSDATVGEGAPADIMDIFSKSWGMMVDNFVLIDPTVVVDTTNSKVVIAGSLIINITGGVAGETNLVKNPITFILKVPVLCINHFVEGARLTDLRTGRRQGTGDALGGLLGQRER